PGHARKKYPGMSLLEAAEVAPVEMRLTQQTVNTHITKMAALFNHAVRERLIDYTPASGMTAKGFGHSQADRLPFEPDELRAIFNAPIYRGCRSETQYCKPGTCLPRN